MAPFTFNSTMSQFKKEQSNVGPTATMGIPKSGQHKKGRYHVKRGVNWRQVRFYPHGGITY